METNQRQPSNAASDHADDAITEDMLIERANLANNELSRSSKSSKSSCSLECSGNQQITMNEDILIKNAVLVKCESVKTTSNTSAGSETPEESIEDEVFDTKEVINKSDVGQAEVRLKKTDISKAIMHNPKETHTVEDPSGYKTIDGPIYSNVKNNNIPAIRVTDVDEPKAQLRDEVNDKLPGIPRLNIEDMEDYPRGCMTPTNSEDDTTNDFENQPTGFDTEQTKPNVGLEGRNGEQCDQNVFVNEAFEEGTTRDAANDEPLDYDFDELVSDIANAISEQEFDTIKAALKGLECLSEHDLIQLSTPLSYLNHLRKYSLISRDNLAHLQTIVCLLGQPEVHMKARQYTEHKFDVVFFFPAKENLLPSYEIVKCHVKGRDFTRLKRSDLESIRTGIANQLFIPSQFVYIVGIEPGFSVTVSLMFHKRFIEVLEEILECSMSQVYKLGVDAVQIRGRTFAVGDTGTTTEEDSNYNSAAFLSVFHQLKENKRQLGEKDKEILRLGQETEFMQLELDTMSAELELLTERALQDAIISRKEPKLNRTYKCHERSLSEPTREVANFGGKDPKSYYRDVWSKPTLTSGYDVEMSLMNLTDIVGSGYACAGPVDLDISSAEHKDKDTLMQEIELLLKELGAKEL